MLEHFFQWGHVPANMMVGTYDLRIVMLSYGIATFASYIALDITGRLRDIDNTRLSVFLWIIGGAFAMGAGIWSMHFIGMLAFSMPNMPLQFDFTWTALSLLVAIMASAFALYLLSYREVNWIKLGLGGVFLGLGIASMHYMGMAGMSKVMQIQYEPSLFIISIAIAIVASEAALYLALLSARLATHLRLQIKVISAMIMGIAICGMHYMGMAAAVMTPVLVAQPLSDVLQSNVLVISISIATIIILTIALLASAYKEAKNQEMLETARHTGMTEVAISVLHNVGNVLNSVNVSANLVNEKILQSKLDLLTNLNILLAKHESDLGEFLTHDPKGKEIPQFLKSLEEYWKSEKQGISEELKSLTNNLHHIKEIIHVQQTISKTVKIRQFLAIDKVIEEALFISGVETEKYQIEVVRQFGKIGSQYLDKVKLLLILVNLIQNAKDALIASDNMHLKLILHTALTDKKVVIDIQDNGLGIDRGTLSKIFIYGFTTKETGHGFGLHSSGLAAREMGGTIHATSEGLGKGAKFTLEFPIANI